MKKILFLVVIFATLILAFLFISQGHNARIDKYNPLIKEQIGYGKVEKGGQIYEDIKIYDKSGREHILSFKGFDPTKEYVKVVFKNDFVYELKYIDKENIPQKIKKRLK